MSVFRQSVCNSMNVHSTSNQKTDFMRNKTVLVVGATGFLGTETCHQLLQADYNVKGLVRDSSNPEKVQTLQHAGVECVIGDLKDPDSLSIAFQGVEAIISTASSTLSRQAGDSIETVDMQGQLNAIDEAEKAGVKKFVFISFNKINETFPLQTAKRKVEERLEKSSMDFTILQPTVFMEVWLSPALGFDPVNASATVYGDGSNPISWISLRDVSAFAVASVDNEAGRKRSMEIGGPDQLSPLEVVRIFEKETGRKFTVTHVPVEALRQQKEAATDSLSKSFAGLMLGYAEGNQIPMNELLKSFPVTLTSVKEYSRTMVPAAEEVH